MFMAQADQETSAPSISILKFLFIFTIYKKVFIDDKMIVEDKISLGNTF